MYYGFELLSHSVVDYRLYNRIVFVQDDGMDESWWNKMSEESEEAFANKSENEL